MKENELVFAVDEIKAHLSKNIITDKRFPNAIKSINLPSLLEYYNRLYALKVEPGVNSDKIKIEDDAIKVEIEKHFLEGTLLDIQSKISDGLPVELVDYYQSLRNITEKLSLNTPIETENYRLFIKSLYIERCESFSEYIILDFCGKTLKGADKLKAMEALKEYFKIHVGDERLYPVINIFNNRDLEKEYFKHKPRTQKKTTKSTLTKLIVKGIEDLSPIEAVNYLDRNLSELSKSRAILYFNALNTVIGKLKKIKNITLRHQYISTWSEWMEISNDPKSIAFLDVHCISAQLAFNKEDAYRLRFVNDKLDLVEKIVHSSAPPRYFKYQEYNKLIGQEQLIDPKQIPKSPYAISYAQNGINCIGGPAPSGLTIPKPIGKIQVEYLGLLSNSEPAFEWLPYDIHMVCPILLDEFVYVFVDYSNPLKPEMLNRTALEAFRYSDYSINVQREFKKKPFKLKKTKNRWNPEKRAAGIPDWAQYPDIPQCPKTGKYMKFVFQLSSFPGIKTISPVKEKGHDTINFWGSGGLFVFIEPESNVVGMLIQNT